MKTICAVLLAFLLISCNSESPRQQQQAVQSAPAQKVSYTRAEISKMAYSNRNITWFAQKFGTPVTDLDYGKRAITYKLNIKNEFGTAEKDVQFFFVHRGEDWISVDFSIF